MTIQCAEIRITPEQAGAIACAEHPDILTRMAWKLLPKRKKETHLIKIDPIYCKYYVAWGTVSGSSSKRVRCAAAMNSALNLVRKVVGTPETHTCEVKSSQIVQDQYSLEQAKDKLREFMIKSSYKDLRGLGSVSFEHFETVYRPFYVSLCERNGKLYRRVVDAMLGERDYLLEYQYKNLMFPVADCTTDASL